MSLVEKDENNIDAICISSIHNENDVNEEILVKDTYANMYLAKNNKVLNTFLYYNKNDEIVNIHLKVLFSTDIEAKTSEILNIAENLRRKRGLKIESNKIGRNELCPCGSGKKYKKCHGI